jgi:diguanylate cyclase
VGNKLIITSAKLISDVFKGSLVFRIGGDEFLIIAVGVEKQRFKAIMNKLCFMVEDTKLKYNTESVGIKISIGVSEMIADRVYNYKQQYEKADNQLYLAKEAGKGCVR